MALKFDVAIRDYIAQYVRPVMYKMIGKEDFMPETMSTSFVARTIFEDVRKEFPHYIIKFSSDNPRNPANQAGSEELKIIDYFNDNPQMQRWEGEISINDKPYFAKFSAMRMEVACLRCHGDPENAPASLLKRYGSTAGFHRPLGKVIGMDTVAIPIVKITEQLWPKLMQAFFLIALGLLLFFLSIICLTRFIVTKRLSSITEHFLTAAQESNYQEITLIEIEGNDEIRDLAVSFNSLCDRLKNFYSSLETQVKDRTQELSDKNEQMEREIEERKRTEGALQESEEKYRTLFESSRDAIMTLAPPTWVFTSGNPATVELFRVRDEAEFISLGPWQVSPERQPDNKPSAEKAMEMIETAMSNGSHFFEWTHCHSDGTPFPAEVLLARLEHRGQVLLQATVRDITERKRTEEEREKLIRELQNAMAEVKTLSGLLPICAHCKNVRDDKGYWNKIESYIRKHSGAQFSHGICPECAKKFFSDFDLCDDSE